MRKAQILMAVLLGVCLILQGSAMAEMVAGTVKGTVDPIKGEVTLSITGEDGVAKDVTIKVANAADLLMLGLAEGDPVEAEGETDSSGDWVASSIKRAAAEHPGAAAEHSGAAAEHPGAAAEHPGTGAGE